MRACPSCSQAHRVRARGARAVAHLEPHAACGHVQRAERGGGGVGGGGRLHARDRGEPGGGAPAEHAAAHRAARGAGDCDGGAAVRYGRAWRGDAARGGLLGHDHGHGGRAEHAHLSPAAASQPAAAAGGGRADARRTRVEPRLQRRLRGQLLWAGHRGRQLGGVGRRRRRHHLHGQRAPPLGHALHAHDDAAGAHLARTSAPRSALARACRGARGAAALLSQLAGACVADHAPYCSRCRPARGCACGRFRSRRPCW